MSEATVETPAQPLSDPIRRAIANGDIGAYALAVATGIKPGTIGRLLTGKHGTNLKTAEKALAILGFAVVGQDDHPRSVSDGLHLAIDEDGRSLYALARASSVGHRTICQFAAGRRNLRLDAAEKLFVALGLKLVRIGSVEPRKLPTPLRPLGDTLRAAIDDEAGKLHALARLSCVHHKSISQFASGRWGLRLNSVDKLFGFFGLAVARISEDGLEGDPLPPSAALRSAIRHDARSLYRISISTGVRYTIILKFMEGCGLMLDTADMLLNKLPLRVVKAADLLQAQPASSPDRPLQPLLVDLREAIRVSGCTGYALAKRSKVSTQTISRFIKGSNTLNYDNYIKLSRAVGSDPMAAGPASVVAKRCPIELNGEGCYPVVSGDIIRVMLTRAEHHILAKLAAAWGASQRLTYGDLAGPARSPERVESPRKVIEAMAKKAAYRPIAVLIRKSGGRPQRIWLDSPSDGETSTFSPQ